MSRGGVVGGGVMGHIPESGGRELSFHALLRGAFNNLLIIHRSVDKTGSKQKLIFEPTQSTSPRWAEWVIYFYRPL